MSPECDRVRIDMRGFDETRCWFASAAAIAKAKNASFFARTEQIALGSLRDARNETLDHRLDLTAAISLFFGRASIDPLFGGGDLGIAEAECQPRQR